MIFTAIACGMLLFFILSMLIVSARRGRAGVSQRMHDYLSGNIRRGEYQEKAAANWRDRFLSLVQSVARLLGHVRQSQNLDYKMQQAGLPLLGTEFIAVTLIVSAAAGVVVFVLTLQWQNALLIIIAVAVFFRFYINIRIAKRRQAFTNQLGDTLSMIADAMRAGFSFMQSIDLAAKEMGPPIGEEFARAMAEIHIGTPTEQALQSMAERAESRDFDLIVAAVLIQRQVGGDLAYILDTISETINSRIRMKREVKTLTAQGRMSGWVLAALPFVLAGILYSVSPSYLQPLISDPMGRMAIGGAVVMEIIGFIIIQRIVDIDV